MTDKEKIREEVVGIINSINLFAPDEDGKNSSYEEGRLDVASKILQVIDSLQEEPVSNPIDFERELYKAFGQVKDFTLGMRIAKWFYDIGKNSQEPVSEELEEELSKLLKECEVDAEYVHQDFLHIVAHHFANWQKQQTITKACDWLKRNADSYTWYNEFDGESGMTEDFIDELKKAIQ